MSRRKLPVLVDRDLSKVRTERVLFEETFVNGVREDASRGGFSITCGVGCSACCSHPVMIGLFEGILLYQWLADHGQWTPDLQARVRKHANATWALGFEVWWLSNIPCPLLKDNQCSAHEGRPLVCRITVSTGDPVFCHPHRFGLQTGIVPRHSTAERFQRMEERLLRAHRLTTIQLPLSKALLVADAILAGKLALEDVSASLASDFKAEG